MSDSGAMILVVDDERPIRRYLRAALASQGYQVTEAVNGKEALNAAVSAQPDIIILDLGLPDLDGVEVTRQLREWSKTPIIILTVRENEGDKIAALDAGADDYLTKPFATGELLARLRVALRHIAEPASESVFQVDSLRIDFARRQVTLQSEELSLTPIEYKLLSVLVQNAGKVLTHRQLLRQVWGVSYETETH